MEVKTYCLLIDADNVSHKYVKGIMDEILRFGACPVRRLFGDVTDSNKKAWKDICLTHSITPIQQYNYTVNKNATDSSLIIHAMDLLYTKEIDGFVIASSDSDFTGLAMRLRENNKEVIGMGEKKTPLPFIKACTEFKYLENLISDEKENKNLSNIDDLKPNILDIINQSDEVLNMSQLSEKLRAINPDFDPRNYGYAKFKKLLEYFSSDLNISDNAVTIKEKSVGSTKIKEVICSILNSTEDKKMNIGELNFRIKDAIPDFNFKNFGYAKFPAYIKTLEYLSIDGNNVALKETLKVEETKEETIETKDNLPQVKETPKPKAKPKAKSKAKPKTKKPQSKNKKEK